MDQTQKRAQQFRRLWAAALAQYNKETRLNIEDSAIPHPQNVDELIDSLKSQHAEFRDDARSNAFTDVIKGAIGPFNFLSNSVGSTVAPVRKKQNLAIISAHAKQMFPGGSQVLAAVGILVNAGQGVTQSFDAVSGLFEDLGQCTKRLNEVSHEDIPDALLPVYQLMLIGLMKVLALATRITFRQMKDVKEGDHQLVIKLKKKLRSTFQNVDEYIKQLLFGGNGEVQGAIGEIRKLVEHESLMMQAVITRKTTKIEAVVKETDTKIELLIQEQRSFSIEIGQAVIDLKSSTAEVSLKIDKISDKIDAGLAETRRNNAVSKANQEEMMAGIKQILQLSNPRDGGTSSEPAAKTATSKTNKKHDTLTSLRVRLDTRRAEKANAAALEMTTGPPELQDTSNWILQERSIRDWLDSVNRLAVVSGEPGFGKTFLAGRTVRELLSKHKPGSQSNDRFVAYFFARKAHPELGSVNAILRTLAFQLAASDKVYAKYLSELFENNKIEKGQSGLFIGEDSTAKSQDEEVIAQQEQSEVEASTSASQVGDQSTESNQTAEIGQEQAPKLTRVPTSAMLTESVETATAQKATLQAVMDSIAGKRKLNSPYEQYLVEHIAGLWKLLFCEYYKSSKTSACMVIDSLDDCALPETDVEVLALWAAINQGYGDDSGSDLNNLQTLLFMKADLATVLLSGADMSWPHVRVDAARNQQDLEKFTKHRIHSAWEDRLVSKALFEHVCKEIVASSTGSFLKAALMIDEIASLGRESIIRENLKQLPSTLEEATLLVISRLRRQLDEHDVEDLQHILAWIVCARRNLSLAELDAVLYLRDPAGARVLDLEKKMQEDFLTLFTFNNVNAATEYKAEERLRARLPPDFVTKLMGSVATKSSNPDPDKRTLDVSDENLERAISRMRGINVELGHSLIKEQIQKRTTDAGTTTKMKTIVLVGCLEAVCAAAHDRPQKIVDTACGYCGLFIPEHIADVDIAEVEIEDRVNIVKHLLRLLREDACIDRWIALAGQYLADDLLVDSNNRDRILSWLKDPEVQEHLDAESREWVGAAIEKPIEVLLQYIARGCARMWLTKMSSLEGIFGFLNRYIHMLRDDSFDEDKSFAFQNANASEIIAAAEWAGLDQNAVWHGRVASALRDGGYHVESHTYYQQAIKMDDQIWHFHSGSAYTYAEQSDFSNAANSMKVAIDLIGKSIERGDHSPSYDPEEFTLRVYEITLLSALAAFHDSANDAASAFEVLETALKGWELESDTTGVVWSDTMATVRQYFEILCASKEWSRAAKFITRLNSHPLARTEAFASIYAYFLEAEPHLRQVAFLVPQLTTINTLTANAITSMANLGSDGQLAQACHLRATILLRLGPDLQTEAIALEEAVVGEEEIMDPTSDLARVRNQAERELARVFLDKALVARENDQWPDVGTWADRLVQRVHSERDPEGRVNFGTRDCSHILAAWHRINGRLTRAKACVRTAVKIGVDMLSDTDPDNDFEAFLYLADALMVVGDVERAATCANQLRRSTMDDVQDEDNDQKTDPDSEDKGKTEDAVLGAAQDAQDDPGTTSETIADTSAESEEPEEGMTVGAWASMPKGPPRSRRQRELDKLALQAAGADKGQKEESNAESEEPEEGMTEAAWVPRRKRVPRPPKEQEIDDVKAHAQDADTEQKAEPHKDEVEELKRAEDIKPRGFWGCDAMCFSNIPDDAVLYRCSYCITDLCVTCHEMIKEGKMKEKGYHICGDTHDHIEVRPAIRPSGSGKIQVGNEEQDLQPWLDALRKEWDL